jgi:hypothetical protein
MLTCRTLLFPALFMALFICPLVSAESDWELTETFELEPVWSGHRVGFSMLTGPTNQYAAYYDAERNMCVASRTLDSDQWTIKRLPTQLGWDSHNSVTLALDAVGNLHVSGNMHCIPLIYFRTSEPGDVTTLQRQPGMTGELENRCTYPRFNYDKAGRLLYTYRDGGSGNGNQIWNVYDHETSTWSRLLDRPLFDGQGLMNAYYTGPVVGPDGNFHVCWVWRDTPDCATNHDLCYARSPDMRTWEQSDGTELVLPISLKTAEVVAPVPPGGGMINGNTRIGFDAEGRVILSYHKYDEDGITQIYNARREADGWVHYQASDWTYRWEFSGGGSIGFEVSVGSVSVDPDGSLRQSFSNKQDGGGIWRLDPETLHFVERAPAGPRRPSSLGRLEDDFPGLSVRIAGDLANSYSQHAPDAARASLESNESYIMRWESRGSNRDRPFPGEIPPPSMLRVYRLVLPE